MLVFRGRVQWCKANTYCVIRTKTALLRVWWAGGILPPDVFVGQLVMGVGKLKTWDSGRDWRIEDALPLQNTDWGSMMKPIYERLFMFAADPAEWCPKEVIDMYRFRRGWVKSKPSTPDKGPGTP